MLLQAPKSAAGPGEPRCGEVWMAGIGRSPSAPPRSRTAQVLSPGADPTPAGGPHTGTSAPSPSPGTMALFSFRASHLGLRVTEED